LFLRTIRARDKSVGAEIPSGLPPGTIQLNPDVGPNTTMDMEKKLFTEKQGQYLAFIYNYSKIHGRAPAEADLEQYFRVTPPTIHQMILRLEEKRLISRVPGQPRSIRLLIPTEELPMLK
jgi:DNA-binding MarR family transcriptional regulator